MTWPWISRRVAEKAEQRAVGTETRLGVVVHSLAECEREWQRRWDARDAEFAALNTRLSEGDAERKLLLDRIVQMTGQPALYDRRPPAAPQGAANGEQAADKAEAMPEQIAPRTKTTFDDVHQAARDAMKDGSFDMPMRRVK